MGNNLKNQSIRYLQIIIQSRCIYPQNKTISVCVHHTQLLQIEICPLHIRVVKPIYVSFRYIKDTHSRLNKLIKTLSALLHLNHCSWLIITRCLKFGFQIHRDINFDLLQRINGLLLTDSMNFP